jgi:hypothetical protein
MNFVFLLWYIRVADTKDEAEILIGAYTSQQEASAAIERLKDKPRFAEAVSGFHIHRYELNKDQWAEGFVTTN